LSEAKGMTKNMILIIGGAYQGKTQYVKEHFGEEYALWNHYHETVRQQLIDKKNPMEEAKKKLQGQDKLVIISNEVGYGLVPMEASEREYREAVGRVNCFFAKEAQQVIRVICGIGKRIK